MSRRTNLVVTVCLFAALGAGAANAAAPTPTPVSQIRTFSLPASSSSRVAPAARKDFAHSWNRKGANGRSVLSTLDLTRIRQFAIRPGGFSVVAAPTKQGGLCFLDSLLGGACVSSFTRGAGMIEGFPQVGGSARTRIRGIVPDGVSAVRFRSKAGQLYRSAVHHNVFEFVAPASLNGGISSFAYIANGKAGAEQPFG
jgi:hypothetical protein